MMMMRTLRRREVYMMRRLRRSLRIFSFTCISAVINRLVREIEEKGEKDGYTHRSTTSSRRRRGINTKDLLPTAAATMDKLIDR